MKIKELKQEIKSVTNTYEERIKNIMVRRIVNFIASRVSKRDLETNGVTKAFFVWKGALQKANEDHIK